MAQTVIGMFESSSKAQEAVGELVEAGITRDRIDISSGNSGSSYSSGSASATSTSYSSGSDRNDDDHESGISKFFKSLFGNDDDDADKYTRVASNAQSIVTVHAQSSDEAERVADILDDNGAVNVDEHASKLGYNRSGSYSAGTGTGMGSTGSADYAASSLAGDSSMGLAGGAGAGLSGTTGYTGSTDNNFTNESNEESGKIPVIEENLEVGKREVRTGGVRVRSRIVERPVEESVRLREERVNVERTPVDRAASAADLQNFQERDIEMVERAEVPVVSKEARVVEEVSIGKEVEERNETIQDTVRKTEVDVENLEKDNVRNRSTNSSSNSGTTNDL